MVMDVYDHVVKEIEADAFKILGVGKLSRFSDAHFLYNAVFPSTDGRTTVVSINIIIPRVSISCADKFYMENNNAQRLEYELDLADPGFRNRFRQALLLCRSSI